MKVAIRLRRQVPKNRYLRCRAMLTEEQFDQLQSRNWPAMTLKWKNRNPFKKLPRYGVITLNASHPEPKQPQAIDLGAGSVRFQIYDSERAAWQEMGESVECDSFSIEPA